MFMLNGWKRMIQMIPKFNWINIWIRLVWFVQMKSVELSMNSMLAEIDMNSKIKFHCFFIVNRVVVNIFDVRHVQQNFAESVQHCITILRIIQYKRCETGIWIEWFCIGLSETGVFDEEYTSCTLLFKLLSGNTWCREQGNCWFIKCLFFFVLFCFHFIGKSFFKAHGINVAEELRQKPQATTPKCPVEGCAKPALATYENRFCE